MRLSAEILILSITLAIPCLLSLIRNTVVRARQKDLPASHRAGGTSEPAGRTSRLRRPREQRKPIHTRTHEARDRVACPRRRDRRPTVPLSSQGRPVARGAAGRMKGTPVCALRRNGSGKHAVIASRNFSVLATNPNARRGSWCPSGTMNAPFVETTSRPLDRYSNARESDYASQPFRRTLPVHWLLPFSSSSFASSPSGTSASSSLNARDASDIPSVKLHTEWYLNASFTARPSG